MVAHAWARRAVRRQCGRSSRGPARRVCRRTRAPAPPDRCAGTRPNYQPGQTGMPMTNQVHALAFWGRVSTEDNQDPESSRGWQITRARSLIESHGGQIVTEFFDIDKSRSIPPQRRPEASRLLAALADPNRGFDAVVVG